LWAAAGRSTSECSSQTATLDEIRQQVAGLRKDDRKGKDEILAAHGANIWKLFQAVIFLDQQMRQSDDPLWAAFLNKHRFEAMNPEEYQKLITNRATLSYSPSSAEVPKMISPQNKFRQKANMAAVLQYGNDKQLPVLLFLASHENTQSVPLQVLLSIGDDSGGAKGPGIFPYCEGIPVVIAENLYTSLGLVNGKEGKAWGVRINKDSKMLTIGQNIFIIDRPPDMLLVELQENIRHTPDVSFNIPANVLPIFPKKVGVVPITRQWKAVIRGSITRTQVPLTPALCITDYKCQGRTYSSVALDMTYDRARNGQRGYASVMVPLSRVKTLKGLSFLRVPTFQSLSKAPDPLLILEQKRLQKLEKNTLKLLESYSNNKR
jgi:hypothetical protein